MKINPYKNTMMVLAVLLVILFVSGLAAAQPNTPPGHGGNVPGQGGPNVPGNPGFSFPGGGNVNPPPFSNGGGDPTGPGGGPTDPGGPTGPGGGNGVPGSGSSGVRVPTFQAPGLEEEVLGVVEVAPEAPLTLPETGGSAVGVAALGTILASAGVLLKKIYLG
jgi:hypothetical protein